MLTHCTVAGIRYDVELDDLRQMYLNSEKYFWAAKHIGSVDSYDSLVSCLEKAAKIIVEETKCFTGDKGAAIANLSSVMRRRIAGEKQLRRTFD